MKMIAVVLTIMELVLMQMFAIVTVGIVIATVLDLIVLLNQAVLEMGIVLDPIPVFVQGIIMVIHVQIVSY